MKRAGWLAGGCAAVLCSVAYANVGTPLMWAETLHLYAGNLLLGVAEGLVLAFFFRLPKLKTIALLILANYISAWVGALYLVPAFREPPPDLYTAWTRVKPLIAWAYGLTLLAEFPFVLLAFWRKKRWLLKAAAGCLLVQTASYALLTGYYWKASETSLYTENTVAEPEAIEPPGDAYLYFISAGDGDVYGGWLAERDWRRVYGLDSKGLNDRLVWQRASEAETWKLVALTNTDAIDDAEHKLTVVAEGIEGEAAAAETRHGRPASTWIAHGDVPKLGAAEDSPAEYHTGFFAYPGLMRGRGNIVLAFDTPLASWLVRNAWQLPGGLVVFQLGDDQICLYDGGEREVALTARGRGPAVILRGDHAKEDPKK